VVAVSCAVAPGDRLAVGGCTTTVLTGTGDTVIVLDPLLPSLVAVIVAVPVATAVTRPDADTVAAAVLLEPHVTTRSVTTFPAESVTVALSWTVCVTNKALLVGDTATVPTGIAVTVMVAVPLLVSLVAVIVAVPTATPVTTPALMVAIAGSLELHVTSRPVNTFPCASFTVAVNVAVFDVRMLADAGATVTLATAAGVTVTAAVPLLPSLVAVIVALPTATAVTSPVVDTVAAAGLLDPQLTVRPVNTPPAESFVVTVSCAVAPSTRLAVGGWTTTVLTGTGDTVIVLDPLLPSLVAVIVAVPVATAVTTPDADTVAAAVLLDPHVTTRSVTTLPAESVTVTLSEKVCVTNMVWVVGDTTTVPTGMVVTVMAAAPLLPSLVAVIVALPMATAVTTPALTVAIAGLLVDHVTGRSVTKLPSESFTIAPNAAVFDVRMVADDGATVTLATGAGVTVTDVVPDFPSLVAVMVTIPGATPVTMPVGETTACVVLLDDHVTGRSVRPLPFTSRTVALS
jgi:hypothetical protein